jgi:hypothetical protein
MQPSQTGKKSLFLFVISLRSFEGIDFLLVFDCKFGVGGEVAGAGSRTNHDTHILFML